MIELHDFAIRHGAFALDGISLRVDSGRYGVLMGPTGQGKTTILEGICGLRPTASGRVLIHGQDVTDWSSGDREIGYVPQDLALFPSMTVREHLEFALRVKRRSPREIRDRPEELSALLGIAHLMHRKTQGLSGGESQRVALGRALSFRPLVLLLDEPLSALDAATRRDMQLLLRKVQKNTKVTTLHVTHNLEEATALADQRFLLDEGSLRSGAEQES